EFEFNPTVHKPIRIAHAPSCREAKGTELILNAVKDLPVKFELIEGVNNNECLKKINECDIFIDQMIWGEHGMASLEAIVMGKPVLCYKNHDKPVGIIPCKPEEIQEKLNYFINNPNQIVEEGKKAREWVEKSSAVSSLIEIYSDVIKYYSN